MYEQTKDISAVYAELQGSNPHEMTFGARRWTQFVSAMFSCHLRNWRKACNKIYGSYKDICSLCNCDSQAPMKTCVVKNRGKTDPPSPLKQCKHDFKSLTGRLGYTFDMKYSPTAIESFVVLQHRGLDKYCLRDQCFTQKDAKL